MTLVMGVLNVTPDSFYDGGHWEDTEAAAIRGCQMVDEGADIVDVGGESTRPGAAPVSESEEVRRVVPVIKELARRTDERTRISVDTRKAVVAEAALEAGASIINDVSATLWPLAAKAGAGWVAMHMRGEPASMMSLARYSDVVSEVKALSPRTSPAGRQRRSTGGLGRPRDRLRQDDRSQPGAVGSPRRARGDGLACRRRAVAQAFPRFPCLGRRCSARPHRRSSRRLRGRGRVGDA